METVNRYILYLYIPLGIAILGCIIALLLRVAKTLKEANHTAELARPISEHLNHINETTKKIAATKESWSFFIALFAIFAILKETGKYYKSERSLSRSFSKAVLRHTSQIKGLRF